MLRKTGIFLAAAAAIVVISPAAFAKKHHHHHHWNKHHDWDGGRVNWNAPFRGRWYGGRLHGYGEGPCWKWKHGKYHWRCG
jgi:hypothetical protein